MSYTDRGSLLLHREHQVKNHSKKVNTQHITRLPEPGVRQSWAPAEAGGSSQGSAHLPWLRAAQQQQHKLGRASLPSPWAQHGSSSSEQSVPFLTGVGAARPLSACLPGAAHLQHLLKPLVFSCLWGHSGRGSEGTELHCQTSINRWHWTLIQVLFLQA